MDMPIDKKKEYQSIQETLQSFTPQSLTYAFTAIRYS